MNIDIINKQVANKLKLKESAVKLVNTYYWRQVYDHLYSYNPRPVNIENVCVLYPEKRLIKKAIKYYIQRLRNLPTSKKFKIGSVKYLSYKAKYEQLLRNFLKLRKQNQFTN